MEKTKEAPTVEEKIKELQTNYANAEAALKEGNRMITEAQQVMLRCEGAIAALNDVKDKKIK